MYIYYYILYYCSFYYVCYTYTILYIYYTILCYSHTKWPLFAQATPYRALLQPGDTLYLPAYWHHEVCVYAYVYMDVYV